MDKNNYDLWQGGPWEQPSPTVVSPPAAAIPAQARARRRPVLRTRRRRRRWPWRLGLTLLVAGGLALTLFLDRYMSFPMTFYWSGPPAWESSLPDDTPREERYSTEPPSIPQAATGTGVTLTLLPPAAETLTHTQIYSKNAPSMVSLEVSSDTRYSTGTGIILTEDGYLVTNAHVVAGADSVLAVFSDNSALPASLVGFAANDDLAVLKVEASGLTPAEFGDSSLLQCGDPVAALGDALGYRSTITDGIISALDRELTVDGISMMLIQTSAAINYGNSGGALINQYGQVVGVTTIKIVSDDGSAESMGFAIPSQRVKYVVDALIDGREIRTAAFGITVSTLPIEGGGLEIIEVDPRSDAYAKGLQAGDVLLTLNGQPITGTTDLARLKQVLGPGDTVDFTYRRDGVEAAVQVALVDVEDLSE